MADIACRHRHHYTKTESTIISTPKRGIERLRQRRDFVAVIRKGRHSRHRLTRLASRRNGLPHNRYGFAVGRRVGCAVIRNRTKRRLREILHNLPIEKGHDILVTAEPGSVYASFNELTKSIEECAGRTGILNGTQASK